MHAYNNDDDVKTANVADILMMGSVCDRNGEKWTNSWSRHMINCCNTALSCNLLFVYDLFLCIFVTDRPKGALFGSAILVNYFWWHQYRLWTPTMTPQKLKNLEV